MTTVFGGYYIDKDLVSKLLELYGEDGSLFLDGSMEKYFKGVPISLSEIYDSEHHMFKLLGIKDWDPIDMIRDTVLTDRGTSEMSEYEDELSERDSEIDYESPDFDFWSKEGYEKMMDYFYGPDGFCVVPKEY
jgi:hypothetical protein